MTEPEHKPCCYSSCGAWAFVRVKRAQGWADVCRTHYTELAQDDAAQWCAEHGLTTLQRMREFRDSWLPRLHLAREPGED